MILQLMALVFLHPITPITAHDLVCLSSFFLLYSPTLPGDCRKINDYWNWLLRTRFSWPLTGRPQFQSISRRARQCVSIVRLPRHTLRLLRQWLGLQFPSFSSFWTRDSFYIPRSHFLLFRLVDCRSDSSSLPSSLSSLSSSISSSWTIG